MSNTSADAHDRPFLFLEHGGWDPSERDKKEVDGYIWFEGPVPEGDRKSIEDGAPAPLRSFFNWSRRGDVLHFGQDQYLDLAIKEAYGDVEVSEGEVPSDEALAVTEEELGRFLADFDAWVLDAHRRAPVFLAIGLEGDPDDEWSRATLEAVPAKVLPRILEQCSSFRAPSDVTREKRSQESTMAWVLFRVLSDYLDSADAGELDDDTKALIARAVERSKGHSAQADDLNESYLRSIQR